VVGPLPAADDPFAPGQLLCVRLAAGRQLWVASEMLVRRGEGAYLLPMRVSDTMRRSDVDVEPMGRGTADWRDNYQQQYANTGRKYDYHEPAYTYGNSLRQEARYRDYNWSRLEPEARRTWEQRYPSTPWDQIKDAVRYSWERAKQAASD